MRRDALKSGDVRAPMLRRPFFWIIAAVIVAFGLAPAIDNDVELRESLLLAAVYITLASNLNLMLGYTGYINFGSIVFFGLGGYICVFLMSAHDWPLAGAVLAAGAAVSLFALLFGLGILRLRGAYFALATIGINEAVKAFVSNFEPWGGSSGLYLPTEMFMPLGGPMQALWIIYFLMVGVMGLSLYLSYGIKTSKFGLGLMAIGQNEDAAALLGVRTPLYKALAYSVSAFLPALAGGLYFFKGAFIQPVDAFDLGLSTEMALSFRRTTFSDWCLITFLKLASKSLALRAVWRRRICSMRSQGCMGRRLTRRRSALNTLGRCCVRARSCWEVRKARA